MTKSLFNHLAKAILIFVVFNTLLSSTANSQSSVQYLDYPDTLVLETHLERGKSLFSAGAGELRYRDTMEIKGWKQYPETGFIYPKHLDSLKASIIAIFFKPLRFYNSLTREVKIQNFEDNNSRFLLTVKGYLNGEEVFIVDQNHNQDLTDDPVRKFHDLDWNTQDGLLRCEYNVEVDGEIIRKHGWRNIGNMHGTVLSFTAQYVESEFSIGSNLFKIGVTDDSGSAFDFYRPQMALLAEKGVMKDTISKREFVLLNEFIFLGDVPYRFHDFYSGSETIVLIREREYEKQIGIQMGLLAPDFTVKTPSGKTIKKDELTEKPIMIVNLTGCGGPGTVQHYRVFEEKYQDKFHIIALGPRIHEDIPGILVDTDDPFNKDFYKIYRDAYSSRDCFHIGLDGRIKDFFNIYSWESGMLE